MNEEGHLPLTSTGDGDAVVTRVEPSLLGDVEALPNLKGR
jgi:hypothetical protein